MAVGADSNATCEPCAAGTFSAAIGANSSAMCTECTKGKFSVAVGANSSDTCAACGVGTFSESMGATTASVCTPCAAGTSSAAAGAGSREMCAACAAGKYSALTGSTACVACPAYASSPVQSVSAYSCVCSPGLALQPTMAARYVHASDSALEGGVVLVLSRGVNVTVRWETLALEVRDAQGVVVAAPELFEGTTRVFVAENADGMFSYTAAASNAAGPAAGPAAGRVALVAAHVECVALATTRADPFHRVFVSAGRLDDSRSCRVRCGPGFFRTHNLRGARCQAHWSPVCGAGEFLVAGTPESNAFCRPCSGCAGRRLVRACTADADDECAACAAGAAEAGAAEAGAAEAVDTASAGARVWVNAHGEPCREGCAGGLVLDQRTRACEACAHRCPPGTRFPAPAARANCTHCEACDAGALPRGAVWDAAEDREDCVATCPVGFRLRSTGALECVEVLPVDRRTRLAPAPIAARCVEGAGAAGAGAAGACERPGCRLHAGVCTPCFEIPEARAALAVATQELTPGAGLMSADDKLRLRWQFTSACEWACLSPWVPVQSADKAHWKCETREVVEAILALNRWSVEPSDGHVEWMKTQTLPEPEAALQAERVLRLVVVLACVGAPIAMLLCVLCLNITRACFALGEHAKAG